MSWTVVFTNKAAKQFQKVQQSIQLRLRALVLEIQVKGPIRGNWKNYGKLDKTKHHCHLKSGRPTYVVCWEILDRDRKTVEVYYVGTHEKAPY
jgi:mRNA-degrading endonuclease RelE of RelBE toxin-antitoxin system